MLEILHSIKRNKIKILKVIITFSVIFFLFSSFFNLLNIYSRDYFKTLTICYLIIVVLFTLISEFSPYILHNYLVFLFPFLVNYSGRGVVYLIVGALYITPEMGTKSNYAGMIFICVAVFCVIIHLLISKNVEVENQNFVVMKDNYRDFRENSGRESLIFPKGIYKSHNNKP